MTDMRERIPVENVLRVFGAQHVAVPKLDGAALADRNAPQGEQNCGLDRENRQHGENGIPRRQCHSVSTVTLRLVYTQMSAAMSSDLRTIASASSAPSASARA